MRNKVFNKLMDEIKELHDKKNQDYAEDDNPYSNFEYAAHLTKQFSDSVDQVFASIIGIKIARLGQLLGRNKNPKNESVRDTMRDLTTYCGIWCCWRNNETIEDKIKAKMDAGMEALEKQITEEDKLENMKSERMKLNKRLQVLSKEIMEQTDKIYYSNPVDTDGH